MHKASREYRVCTNCVMDTTDSLIRFDERGFCDHCNNYYSNILPHWHPDETGAKELQRIVNQIKSEGRNREYDCLVGLSGGVDSSYLVYLAVRKLGLRPCVFTVDTGWNSTVANTNIQKLTEGLGLRVHQETVDWEEMKDLQKAFFKSQLPSIDVQDHAIFAALYNFAARNGFRYVLTGSNYSTECVREPIEWAYANDLTLIRDVHRRFGTIPLRNFPMCGMLKYRLYYRYIRGMRVIHPLNYVPYRKEDAINELEAEFGWERYANKHFESVFTRFYEGYWLVKKFGYDKRRAHFSSLILTGQMTRDEALRIIAKPPYDEEAAMIDMEYIAKRLDMTKEELIDLMNGENKSYRDYRSDLPLLRVAIGLARLVGAERRNFR